MANYGLTLVTAPTSEPLTLAEAKTQCGVATDIGYHNEQLEALVEAAREKVETDTGRALMSQTWDYEFDLFPCGLAPIYLPKNPVSSITHVKYYDTDGTQQTLATTVYHASRFLNREPAEVRLKKSQQWPSLYGEQGVISVRFVCGYANALAVPESLKSAVKLLLKAWFDHEEVNEDTYKALIAKWQTGDEFHQYGRSFSYA
jgi:uncharacterized phiE125 gp8 family phage protein